MKRILMMYVLLCFCFIPILASPSLAAAPFYEDKVLTIIVGFAAGTGYDQITRVVAKTLPKYLPGKPSIVIQNMDGASSMIAANHVYNRVKPDGLTLFSTHRGLAFMQLLKVDGVKFDMQKFAYIGSVAAETVVLCLRTTLPYKTFDELKKSNKVVYIGGPGPGTITTQMANLSKDYLGLNVKYIEYRNTPEIILAMEQKELDGVWLAYNSAKPYLERGQVRLLVRARVSQKGIEHLPVTEDLTPDPMGKTILAMLGRTGVMGRLFLAPPGTPANVMAILKEAFAKTLKDPELQADAAKASVELEYISDEECHKLMDFMFSQPPEVLKVFGKYVKY
jgi:tripartite-type tricarboxylate transporter receptor subunit TctC